MLGATILEGWAFVRWENVSCFYIFDPIFLWQCTFWVYFLPGRAKWRDNLGQVESSVGGNKEGCLTISGQISGLFEFYAVQLGWVRARWVFRTEVLAVVTITLWLVWILCDILQEPHWGSEDLDLGWYWLSHGSPNICQSQQQETSTAGKWPANTACLKLQ